MAKPKKPRGQRVGQEALNLYVDEDLRKQMDAFISEHNSTEEHKASVRSTVEAALKLYLKGKGFWPPPKPADE